MDKKLSRRIYSIAFTFLGVCLCALFLAGTSVGMITFSVFIMMDEMEYYFSYITLMGPYLSVNLVFLAQYLMMVIGSWGIPSLIAGLIFKKLSDKLQ